MASIEPVGRLARSGHCSSLRRPRRSRWWRSAREHLVAVTRQAVRPRSCREVARGAETDIAAGGGPDEVHVLAGTGQSDIRAVEIQAPGTGGRRPEGPDAAQQVLIGQGRRSRRETRYCWTAAGGDQQAAVGQERKGIHVLIAPVRPTSEPSKYRLQVVPFQRTMSAACTVLGPVGPRLPHRGSAARRSRRRTGRCRWAVVDEGVDVSSAGNPECAGIEHPCVGGVGIPRVDVGVVIRCGHARHRCIARSREICLHRDRGWRDRVAIGRAVSAGLVIAHAPPVQTHWQC